MSSLYTAHMQLRVAVWFFSRIGSHQDMDRYPSAKATLLIGRAEALIASHQRGGLDALHAARLAPTQSRTWWALRDAMVAAKKPHAALTALRALYESTEDATTRKSIRTDAAVLCKDATVNHSFCDRADLLHNN